MMTNQRAFNKAGRHLLKQNKRSVMKRAHRTVKPMCAYRGRGGLMCAVGVLIPDDEYRPSMEGAPIGEVECRVNDEVDECLLEYLQILHDATHPNGWAKGLKKIASDFGLQTRWVFP